MASGACIKCNLDVSTSCNGIKCDNCNKWVHYFCSLLPAYMIMQLTKSTRKFSCIDCVHSKIGKDHPSLCQEINEIMETQNLSLKCVAISNRHDSNPDLANDSNPDSANAKNPNEKPTSDEIKSHTPEIKDAQIITVPDVNQSQSSTQSIVSQDLAKITTVHPDPKTNPTPTTTPSIAISNQHQTNPRPISATASSRSTPSQPPAKPLVKPPCKYYLQGHCQYGYIGSGCPDPHPELCINFLNRRCYKGNANCRYVHPKLCPIAERSGKCERRNCFYYHLDDISRPKLDHPTTVSHPATKPLLNMNFPPDKNLPNFPETSRSTVGREQPWYRPSPTPALNNYHPTKPTHPVSSSNSYRSPHLFSPANQLYPTVHQQQSVPSYHQPAANSYPPLPMYPQPKAAPPQRAPFPTSVQSPWLNPTFPQQNSQPPPIKSPPSQPVQNSSQPTATTHTTAVTQTPTAVPTPANSQLTSRPFLDQLHSIQKMVMEMNQAHIMLLQSLNQPLPHPTTQANI